MAARSHISNSILFTLLMRLHQLKPSPRSRYGRRTGWDFCQHPFHFSPPTSASSPSLCNTNTPPPSPSECGCLDYHFGSKRGLTKVSMVTVQSVNHAAADVSSPSLFPFSPSFTPTSCLYTTPPFFPGTLVYLPRLSSSLSPAIKKPSGLIDVISPAALYHLFPPFTLSLH